MPVLEVIPGRARDLGGFSVRRVLPIAHRKSVGPFVFFDHLGPVRFEPGSGIEVRPHPHIGLATVTYLFEGRILHRDSLGSVQAIEPGAVNWMTAGRGIVHSERSTPEDRRRGAPMHGVQCWVALPISEEERRPDFVHHPAESLPIVALPGTRVKIIAGDAFGEQSPVVFPSPIFLLEAQMVAGAALTVPDHYEQRALYPVDVPIQFEGKRFEPGQMLVIDAGAAPFEALASGRVMVLGGAPIDAERHLWWNFVSSRRSRIELAKSQWSTGQFGQVPGETEFIPLPAS